MSTTVELASVSLLTVIAEEILAEQITRDLTAAGATGYTVSAASGHGSRHLRSGSLAGENVRIEVLSSPALAETLLRRIAERYFTDYAVIAWLSEARVLRGDKYAAP